MKPTIKSILLGSTGIACALGFASAAYAEDVLETVIVTAEKQAADIQKTSVSITAIQPDTAAQAGQTRLKDMLQNVAGVAVYQGAGTNGAFFVRGIGTTQGVSSTPEMVDGVNTIALEAESFASADAARIEILRGPQGTLYGRGALSGVVNIITNDPEIGKYSGKIVVEGGAYNLVSANAIVNIPLSDDMALRVVASSRQQSGFMHPDGRANTDYQAGRIKLLYKPNEDFKFELVASTINNMGSGSSDALPQSVRNPNFASPAFGGFNPCGGDPHPNKYDAWHSPPKYYGAYSCTVPAQPPVNPNPVTGVCQIVSRQETQVHDVGFNAEYDMGWSSLTVIANMNANQSNLGAHAANPFLGTVPPNDLWNDNYDQIAEARLNSDSDSWLKWVAGIYWDHTHNHIHNWNRISGITAAAPLGNDNRQEQILLDKSTYGQVTVPIIDRLRVIGGLRYAMDDVSQSSFAFNVGKHIKGQAAPGDFPTHKLTYKAGFEFDITPDSMLYANTATGFRPTVPAQDRFCVGNTSHHRYLINDGSGAQIAFPTGGCTTTGAGAVALGGAAGEATTNTVVNLSVPPDSMTAYEAGIKNRFLDNKLQVNLDGYYYKFQSLFTSALGINNINQAQSIYQQFTGTKAYGSELEIALLVTSNDRINIGLSYEPTQVGQAPYIYPQCYNYGTAAHTLIEVIGNTINRAACNAKNLAANPATVNWVRYRPSIGPNDALINAPRWNGNVGYQHIFDLSSGATVTATAAVHFESSKQTAVNYFYDGINPAFHTTDASITYDTADGKWSLAAWVKNIENHPIIQGAQNGSGTDYVYPTYAPPRMWGVNLSAKF